MVNVVGLRILVVLAVVHNIVSQHVIQSQQNDATFKSQIAYQGLHHESYTKNVRHTSYAQHQPQVSPVQQSPFDHARTYLKQHTYTKSKSTPTEISSPVQQSPFDHARPYHKQHTYTNSKSTPTEISIKQPDEKIIHHPSPIYVNRPPTFVTINHPDIVIEPNPVVYHKPAAVVRSPVVYKTLPRAVKYRHVVKHIVKPIEKKVVLERTNVKPGQYASQSQMFKPKINSERQQVHYLNEESDTSNDASETDVSANIPRRVSRVIYRQPTNDWNQVRQEQDEIHNSNEQQVEIIDVDERRNKPLEINHIYEQKFQQNELASFNLGQQVTHTAYE